MSTGMSCGSSMTEYSVGDTSIVTEPAQTAMLTSRDSGSKRKAGTIGAREE